MKKVIYGVLLIAVFGLTACGNNKKEETTASSKVEQLESRVKELESSSSSSEKEVENAQTDRPDDEILSDISSDKTKEIVKVFLDNGLKMYDYDKAGVAEQMPADQNDPNGMPIYDDWFTFFTSKGTEGMILEIKTYPELSVLNEAYDLLISNSSYTESDIVKNENINSILVGKPTTDSEKKLFNNYKEVFEKIQ